MSIPESLRDLSENVRKRFFIGGEWVRPKSEKTRSLVSPVDEAPWIDAPLAGVVDVDNAVSAARKAFDLGPWPRATPAWRAERLRRMSGIVRARSQLLANVWTAEVGAPITFANQFVPFASAMLDYYATLLETYPFRDVRPARMGQARVRREAIGVAALIVPWNATTPILSFKLAAALAAGCTVVVKSPPETPFDALILAEAAEAAGIPPGVLNVITADRLQGSHLVASPGIDKVSFTGSTAAGKQIAKVCIDRMTRFTLELGGKSAAIILPDADLSQTLPSLVPFTVPFSGQICFAQTRVLIPRSRAEEIENALSAIFGSLKVGDPWKVETQLGPLASATQMSKTLGYIQQGQEQGARLLAGGQRDPAFTRGYFVRPTLFTDVTSQMSIARDEIFGPVVSVMPYAGIDEAISIANSSEYGLSGTVFSSDPERAYEIATRIKSGHIGVNGFDMAPGVPFGGYKSSGMGREGGPEGLEAFLETQAVYMPGAP
jgi:acyl-CoA reductase-like NAD-dependent aldehyde dehydrogenase